MWDSIIARLDPRRGTISSLIGLSSLGHLLFLVLVLFRCGQGALKVSLKTSERRILMMRTIRKISSRSGMLGGGSRSAAQSVYNAQSSPKASVPLPAKTTQQPQKKKVAAPSVTTREKAPVAQKASRHKQLAQRSHKKLEKREKRKQKKEPAPLSTVVEKSVVLPAQVAQPVEVEKPYLVTMGDGAAGDAAVGADEQAAYDTIDEIRSAICATWRPPKGVRAKRVCTIRVTIHDRGKVTATKVVTTSGNAAFDMAARQALVRANYPHTLWRRELVVEFS